MEAEEAVTTNVLASELWDAEHAQAAAEAAAEGEHEAQETDVAEECL